MEKNKEYEVDADELITRMRERTLKKLQEGKMWKCGTPKIREKLRKKQQEDSQKKK